MAAEPIDKDPGDTLTYEMSFGFMPEVIQGRTLTSCVISSAVLNGGSGSITVGAHTITHPIVFVALSGGADGNSYRITFTATYDNGQTRVLNGPLNVAVK